MAAITAAARLLLGILATHPITSFVTGDASLRSRPMQRVTDPLSRFGAKFTTREGGRLPGGRRAACRERITARGATKSGKA